MGAPGGRDDPGNGHGDIRGPSQHERFVSGSLSLERQLEELEIKSGCSADEHSLCWYLARHIHIDERLQHGRYCRRFSERKSKGSLLVVQSAPGLLNVGEEKWAGDSLKGFCNAGEMVGHALFRSVAKACGNALSKADGSVIDQELPTLCDLTNNSQLAKYTMEQPGREALLLECLNALGSVLQADKATDTAALNKAAACIIKLSSESPAPTPSFSRHFYRVQKPGRCLGRSIDLSA